MKNSIENHATGSRDRTCSDAEWALRVDLAAAFRLAAQFEFRILLIGNIIKTTFKIQNIILIIFDHPRTFPNPEPAVIFFDRLHLHTHDLAIQHQIPDHSLPIFYIDSRISRIEGGLLLTYYVAYMVYIIMQAANSPALSVVAFYDALFILISFVVLAVFVMLTARAKRVHILKK